MIRPPQCGHKVDIFRIIVWPYSDYLCGYNVFLKRSYMCVRQLWCVLPLCGHKVVIMLVIKWTCLWLFSCHNICPSLIKCVAFCETVAPFVNPSLQNIICPYTCERKVKTADATQPQTNTVHDQCRRREQTFLNTKPFQHPPYWCGTSHVPTHEDKPPPPCTLR